MTLPLSNLTAISPVDGRYGDKTAVLRTLFSEYGLIRHRIQVELAWLNTLLETGLFSELSGLSDSARRTMQQIHEGFNLEQAQKVKDIEATINHDVKAVEYFIADHFQKDLELKKLIPLIHFACTSEDINNLSWALILRQARNTELLPAYQRILDKLSTMANAYAAVPMLARTHGQAASPTTVGKEFANTAYRLDRQMSGLQAVRITGKFSGAVGNFNAHVVAFPETDWTAISRQMLESLQIEYLSHTTQIEPHDYIAELLHAINRSNTILIDLCRDIWGYISLGYFCQRAVSSEVGSSTMPHKINPIDFENAEGNFGIANSLSGHLAEKLPISRWQRDLSDSTVLRSLGMVFSHTLIALEALSKGLDKLEISVNTIEKDLDNHWEVLAEAVQIILRKHKVSDAYEQLKALTRGQEDISAETIRAFVDTLDIPQAEKDKLLSLTPQNYIGLARQLAEQINNS